MLLLYWGFTFQKGELHWSPSLSEVGRNPAHSQCPMYSTEFTNDVTLQGSHFWWRQRQLHPLLSFFSSISFIICPVLKVWLVILGTEPSRFFNFCLLLLSPTSQLLFWNRCLKMILLYTHYIQLNKNFSLLKSKHLHKYTISRVSEYHIWRSNILTPSLFQSGW